MHAILDPEQDRRSLSRASTLGLALCSLLLLVPLAAFRPFSAGGHSLEMREWGPPDVALVGVTSDIAPIPPVPAIPEIPSIPAIPAIPSFDTGEFSKMSATLATTRAALAEVRANAASIAASVAPAVAIATTSTATRASWNEQSCSSVSLNRSGSSTSIHSSSDDDDSSFQYISSSSGRCLQVAVWGKVEFSPDEREITRVSRDGRLYVRERRNDSDKELTVTSGDGDEPRYAYSVDGERANFDDDGRAWLSDLLPGVLRESGLNAKQRVARLRRQGGVGAVLSDISRTQSTGAKRAAYEALLQSGNLSDEDEARIARQAGNDLSSSDGELRAVLAAVGKQGHLGPPMAEAIGAAVEHMSSDGEKRELLQQYAQQGDRDMLLVAMRRANSISSDGEKSEFLKSTVARYLANDDEGLRSSFFNVTQSISSDGEKREVLMSTLPYAQRPNIMSSVLETGRQISSDGEKSELLIAILHKRCITTPELKDAFMRTTRTLSSDGEYRRVMEAMLEAKQ